MRLTVIGCSGSFPGPDSAASCYLVEADEGDGPDKRTWRILLELGNGALGQLQRHVDPLTIDAVLVSHLHPDHCVDLCGYYVMRKYHPRGAQPRIPVYGPAGVADRLARAYDLPLDPGMHGEFDFREYDGRFEIGPFSVLPVAVEHPVPAYSLRITVGDSVLAYSGDTAPCEGFDRVAASARLLLAEASFRDHDENPPGIHLTGRDAGETAARGGVGRLVLTHIPPWFDQAGMLAEAKLAYSGPVDLAEPGGTYEF